MKGGWKYKPLEWLLYGLSHMPFKVLYAISDVLFVMVYYVVRYRRRVVLDNITASFPDMSAKECRKVARDFYLNLTDYFVETIKLHHITNEEMMRHMEVRNTEVVDKLFDEGRSIVAYFSHCFNWEWAPSITLWTSHKPSAEVVFSQVYRPLRNEWFDKFFLALRSRFHSESFAKRTVLRDLIKQQRAGVLGICGFMSDQKPSHGDPTHVMRFLNHPTAMITGTETLARRLDMAVVYMDISKVKRGQYVLDLRLITKTPNALPEMAITERYARMLEQTINRNPSIWLWSHKRWKIPVSYDNQHPEA